MNSLFISAYSKIESNFSFIYCPISTKFLSSYFTLALSSASFFFIELILLSRSYSFFLSSFFSAITFYFSCSSYFIFFLAFYFYLGVFSLLVSSFVVYVSA